METAFRHVREPCAWTVTHTVDILRFDLPRVAVTEWAQDTSIFKQQVLEVPSGSSVLDDTLSSFGLAILPFLDRKAKASQFFVDHILNGVCSYIFHSFSSGKRVTRGGLAPWQMQRAKEVIDSRIDANLALADVADECGLSVAHFSRAFRETCGITPYKWLISRRIEKARTLLTTTDLPLALVATECGFADQSHLTNVFSKNLGTPPGAFRRHWHRRATGPSLP
jgi:AraC-like DNA-binding protein